MLHLEHAPNAAAASSSPVLLPLLPLLLLRCWYWPWARHMLRDATSALPCPPAQQSYVVICHIAPYWLLLGHRVQPLGLS